MEIQGLSFDVFPAGGGFDMMIGKLLALPNGPQATVSGETAQVKISLPPELFAGTGARRFPGFERWSGAMLIFNRIDGDWKLNTDRTVNFVVSMEQAPGSDKDPLELTQQIIEFWIKNLTDITDAIESGSIKNSQEVVRVLKDSQRMVAMEVQVEHHDIKLLPVIGGTN
jgi:hypothetical protein